MTDVQLIADRRIYRNSLALKVNPLSGDYNLNHLRSFHVALLKRTEYLLNSMPGVLREQNPPGNFYQRDWSSFIGFGDVPIHVTTVHSRMSIDDINVLESNLRALQVNKFSSLMTNDFAKNLAHIYILSDFIHPFHDVNTRTLGSFLSQFANECGFKTIFDPEIYRNTNDLGYFYISRAKSVNEYVIKLLRIFS